MKVTFLEIEMFCMQNQDLQGISVTRSVVFYRVHHYHEEDDITYYSDIQKMQDKYV